MAVVLPESQVRLMRDNVFESVSSDHNWFHCRDGWMTQAGIKWLMEKLGITEVVSIEDDLK